MSAGYPPGRNGVDPNERAVPKFSRPRRGQPFVRLVLFMFLGVFSATFRTNAWIAFRSSSTRTVFGCIFCHFQDQGVDSLSFSYGTISAFKFLLD